MSSIKYLVEEFSFKNVKVNWEKNPKLINQKNFTGSYIDVLNEDTNKLNIYILNNVGLCIRFNSNHIEDIKLINRIMLMAKQNNQNFTANGVSSKNRNPFVASHMSVCFTYELYLLAPFNPIFMFYIENLISSKVYNLINSKTYLENIIHEWKLI